MESVKLSVLDVGLIRTNQSAANAFSSMISLAQHAEKLGYHRYWLGEHHNLAGVVASQTAVFAPAVGAVALTSGGSPGSMPIQQLALPFLYG